MALLDGISGPADLRGLPEAALSGLAAEIRAELTATVQRTGGHLGPNLGVVELTIALHRVFDSPRDPIVFDTGHQAYVHKLLTGRRPWFPRLRAAGGPSGYPSRAESRHDLVENSHASTALSYADGLSRAFALRGEPDRTVVAVVGDGALTGGMCWEALNNIGASARPVVVLLNDNGRSYSPTVGAIPAHLAALRAGKGGPTLFERLGLAYRGPVDGHDPVAVQRELAAARALRRPVVVHCVTVKGKGHPPAEDDAVDCMHTVSPPGGAGGPGWTAVFGEELCAIGRERDDVVALTAAMLHPTGLAPFAAAFPRRVVDVGIAEQHAMTCAAGLAMGGLHPVVCVYATFLNRAFDQTLMDVALHRLPVTLVLDRAGVTGPDGPSHHGMWDLSLLGAVPGMRVAAPRDATRLRALLRDAVADAGPTALRFPKGAPERELPACGRIGTADVLARHGSGGVLLLPVGPCAAPALAAAADAARDGGCVTVVDPRWLLPVDPALVAAAGMFRAVVTVEDNGAAGGYGDAVARTLRAAGSPVPVHTVALEQAFLPHGSRSDLLAGTGLDAAGIRRAIEDADTGVPAPVLHPSAVG
ncbi:1-deoxy-D-xylulose-5-phosphate synthase [Pseudonocardia adelaidensis]|uniref:1-deoxy-D-xylulose-5-phosphate synthase n=1 Tax=Pseudonocardia adelaidensis TaxID=648754 RepID=A0ABP9NDX6_9PSEU